MYWNGKDERIACCLLIVLVACAVTNGMLQRAVFPSLEEFHLVRCLTYISHRYFPPGRPMLIAAPSTERYVQQNLIADIQQTSLWPVVVSVDGNIDRTRVINIIQGNGSYIILIGGGNYSSFEAEFMGIALSEGKLTRSWNSEALFIVAGATEFPKSLQTDIFNLLSKFRIYNCIIVSQVHYMEDKMFSGLINGNDLSTVMKLGVYTWYPYKGPDQCTEVNEITLLDIWVMTAHGNFIKNVDLFQQKFGNTYNGCPMKAIVRDVNDVFATKYIYDDYKKTVFNRIEGLEIEILKIVLEKVNMTPVYVPVPEGFDITVGNLSGVIKAMTDKEAYIALGGVPMLYMHPYFDFTNSYSYTTLRWYVPCSIKNERWSSLFRIFSLELWIAVMISVVLSGFLTAVLGRYSHASEWQAYKTMNSALTNAWAVILGVSVSSMPRTHSLRSFFLAWVCFSLAFSTVFQAFLTTFLTESGYKQPIQSMDELLDSDVLLGYPSVHHKFVMTGEEEEVTKIQKHGVDCKLLDDCVYRAMSRKDISVLLNDGNVDFNFAIGSFIGDNSEPLLCKLDDGAIFTTGQTMLMFHVDPLFRVVNSIIQRVIEADLSKFMVAFPYYHRIIKTRKIGIIQPLAGYYSFNLYHLQPAFYLLLMGWCLNVICFLLEVIYNCLQRKQK